MKKSISKGGGEFLGAFKCGGILTGVSGFIGSEGFPGVYPPNSKCTWKITVPEGKVVVLSFRFIDLESDNLCRYDFVDVYNGHVNGQRLGRFCGTFRPGALVANSNKMLVQMISDANTAGNGFVAKYSAAEPHERELKFEKFDVERDNYCRYDYVAVFNGGKINDARRIGKYCGDSPPALTADGFIGHYIFRPKKLPTTTSPITTTTLPTIPVITGSVITTNIRGGSLYATVSIINVYKEGNLAIQQAGKNLSAKIIAVCKQCPVIRRGLNYVIMGQVEEDGRGKLLPGSFTMSFKTKNQKILNALKNK
ncbi:Procollagen C-endopeptidase enhancer 2, partial [Ophiophagus hannah]